MSNDTTIKLRNFLFLGASHMRYNFDGVIDFLFGGEVIRNIQRKHIDLIVEKLFRFDWNVFVSEMSEALERFCLLSDSKVVFIQTGHWDLMLKGLRYIIRNYADSPGYKLLHTLRDIFSGALPCPGISHIVWMTAVPYLLCFSHKENSLCDTKRGQRYNANIRVLNEFFLRGLLSSYANVTANVTATSTATELFTPLEVQRFYNPY
eukprot:gene9878-20551_t